MELLFLYENSNVCRNAEKIFFTIEPITVWKIEIFSVQRPFKPWCTIFFSLFFWTLSVRQKSQRSCYFVQSLSSHSKFNKVARENRTGSSKGSLWRGDSNFWNRCRDLAVKKFFRIFTVVCVFSWKILPFEERHLQFFYSLDDVEISLKENELRNVETRLDRPLYDIFSTRLQLFKRRQVFIVRSNIFVMNWANFIWNKR